MFDEIIKKYSTFPDALITQLHMSIGKEQKIRIQVRIHCYNLLYENKLEYITLLFDEVLSFNLFNEGHTNITFINAALLKKENNDIICDFFPIFMSNDLLIEDKDSPFRIRCTKISCELLPEELFEQDYI